MSSPTAFDAIKARLNDFAALPVRYENDPVQDLIEAGTPAWVYVEVWGDNYRQDTMGAPGANMWEESGVAYLHVMTPSLEGSRTARQHAEALSYLFREQDTGLLITEMSIGAGEPGRDFPNFWALTLTIWWSRRDITEIPTP